MNVIFSGPATISGVSTDGFTIAISDFQGWVRVLNPMGGVELAEKRATQLNAVAVRDGVVACDDDSSTLETGVAITIAGMIIKQADFGLNNALAIDKSGQFAVATDNHCYDRLGGGRWNVIPAEMGHDKWPMGVELLNSTDLLIASQDGWLRQWRNRNVVRERFLAQGGLNGVDVSPDGTRIVVVKLGGSNDYGGMMVLNDSMEVLFEANESALIHQARFLADNRIVYGTADGRLCLWDGHSSIYIPPTVPATPATPTKPNSGKPDKPGKPPK